jgi:hypothetical protein
VRRRGREDRITTLKVRISVITKRIIIHPLDTPKFSTFIPTHGDHPSRAVHPVLIWY